VKRCVPSPLVIRPVTLHPPFSASFSPARGTIQTVLSRGCYFAFGYLAMIILVRGLGPVDYGVYGLIMSVLLWIEQTSRFTISPAVAILVAGDGDKPTTVEQTALFMNFFLFLLLFVLLWFAAPLLADLFDLHGGTRLFRIAALDLPFFGIYVIYRGVLQGHQQFLPISIADVIYSLTKLAGILLLLTLWLSVPSVLIVNALASIAGMLFLLPRISVNMVAPVYDSIRRLARIALPLGIYMLTLQGFGYLDLWCLKVLNPSDDPTTLGLYVAARNVAFVPSFIFVGVSEVILPTLSGAVKKNEVLLSQHYVRGAVRFLWTTVLPVTVLFMLTARELMSLLYSSTFERGGIYLAVLVITALLFALIALLTSVLNVRGETRVCVGMMIALIVIALAINTLLIPTYGALGAAYSMAFASFLGVLVFGVLVHRQFGPLMKFHTFLRTVVAALLMAVLVCQFNVTGLLLAPFYLICLATYGLVLIALGEISRADLDTLAVWRA
jgi:O-antigen/teichoic acid export membrane protein